MPLRYRLIREIGQGGMGAVLLVHDSELEREVALKVIKPGKANEKAIRRFITEAKITAQLEHPAIMPVHDAGTLADKSLYFTPRGDTAVQVKWRVRNQHRGQPMSALKTATYPCEQCGGPIRARYLSDLNRRFCGAACRNTYAHRAAAKGVNLAAFNPVDQPEKAYWLGFLLADGCISKVRFSYKLTVLLSGKDRAHLEKFMDFLGLARARMLEAKRRESVVKHSDGRTQVVAAGTLVSVATSLAEIVDPLLNLGCVPRKSFVVRFPSLGAERLDLACLLGYYDGNGTRLHQTENHVSGSVYSASRAFLEDVCIRFGLSPQNVFPGPKPCFRLHLPSGLVQHMMLAFEGSLPRKRFENLQPNRSNRVLTRWKGVSRGRPGIDGRTRWTAKVKNPATSKFHHCGTFDTEDEAARAYNVKARELMGPLASLNLIAGNGPVHGIPWLAEEPVPA